MVFHPFLPRTFPLELPEPKARTLLPSQAPATESASSYEAKPTLLEPFGREVEDGMDVNSVERVKTLVLRPQWV